MNIELINKLWERTELKDKHWLWTGYIHHNGYGSIYHNGSYWKVNRLSLCIYLKTPYYGIWDTCHICEHRHCWNPLHLYIGTRTDNVNDAIKKGTMYDVSIHSSRKTHCHYGHEYNKENTYITPEGKRVCKICRKETKLRFRNKEIVSNSRGNV